MRSLVAGALMALALSSCAYNAQISPTSAPASEIMPGKMIGKPTSFSYSSTFNDLNKVVRPGSYQCSAHNFPVDAEGAFRKTFDRVNRLAFANIVPPGAGSNQVSVDVDDFDLRLHFAPGFWSLTATAEAEVIFKVRVASRGRDVARFVVSGSGKADYEGGCNAGSMALEAAVEKALRRAADQYVQKVVNSGPLK